MKDKSGIKHIITAIFLSMLIISAAVALTLAFKQMYYVDVQNMNLAEETGYSYEEIVENYDALVKYNQDVRQAELELTLPMSEEGRIHFAEVKNIFVFIQYIMLPLGLFGTYFGIRKIKKDSKPCFDYLKWTSIFTVAVPAVLASFVAIAWDQVFVIFHKIFFNNDYWIFDPDTDPIITLLPDEFFMHCAIMIIVLVLISGVVCFLLYKKNTDIHTKMKTVSPTGKATYTPKKRK